MAFGAGTLECTVEFAKDLKDTDWFGKQDPYATLELGSQHHKTRTHKGGGTAPVWNETFTFNVLGGESDLIITVKDEDLLKDDILGRAVVSLVTARVHGRDRMQAPLLRANAKKQKGYISVALKFTPAAGSAGASAAAAPAQGVPQQQAATWTSVPSYGSAQQHAPRPDVQHGFATGPYALPYGQQPSGYGAAPGTNPPSAYAPPNGPQPAAPGAPSPPYSYPPTGGVPPPQGPVAADGSGHDAPAAESAFAAQQPGPHSQVPPASEHAPQDMAASQRPTAGYPSLEALTIRDLPAAARVDFSGNSAPSMVTAGAAAALAVGLDARSLSEPQPDSPLPLAGVSSTQETVSRGVGGADDDVRVAAVPQSSPPVPPPQGAQAKSPLPEAVAPHANTPAPQVPTPGQCPSKPAAFPGQPGAPEYNIPPYPAPPGYGAPSPYGYPPPYGAPAPAVPKGAAPPPGYAQPAQPSPYAAYPQAPNGAGYPGYGAPAPQPAYGYPIGHTPSAQYPYGAPPQYGHGPAAAAPHPGYPGPYGQPYGAPPGYPPPAGHAAPGLFGYPPPYYPATGPGSAEEDWMIRQTLPRLGTGKDSPARRR